MVYLEVFGATSSLTLLVTRGGKLVWSTDQKTSFFLKHFDAEQCSDSFQ